MFSDLRKKDRDAETDVTLGGQVTFEFFNGPDLNVGPIHLRNETVTRTDFSPWTESFHRPIFGWIGVDVLQPFVLQLDFDGGKLRFLRSDNATHPEWGTCKQIMIYEGVPCVELPWRDRQVPFVLDTGFFGSIAYPSQLFDAIVSSRKIPVESNPNFTAAGTRWLRRVRFPDWQCGNWTYRGMILSEAQSDLRILGLGFLRRNLVTFDFPRGLFYFRPNNQINRRDKAQMSGLHIFWIGPDMVAKFVDVGSPAYEAGMRDGDILVGINGKPMKDYDYDSLREVISSAEGQPVTVTYRRGGDEHTAIFKLHSRI